MSIMLKPIEVTRRGASNSQSIMDAQYSRPATPLRSESGCQIQGLLLALLKPPPIASPLRLGLFPPLEDQSPSAFDC